MTLKEVAEDFAKILSDNLGMNKDDLLSSIIKPSNCSNYKYDYEYTWSNGSNAPINNKGTSVHPHQPIISGVPSPQVKYQWVTNTSNSFPYTTTGELEEALVSNWDKEKLLDIAIKKYLVEGKKLDLMQKLVEVLKDT